MPLELRLYL
jgi:hypothetical protein